MVKSILVEEGALRERLQKGKDAGFSYYDKADDPEHELNHYINL